MRQRAQPLRASRCWAPVNSWAWCHAEGLQTSIYPLKHFRIIDSQHLQGDPLMCLISHAAVNSIPCTRPGAAQRNHD